MSKSAGRGTFLPVQLTPGVASTEQPAEAGVFEVLEGRSGINVRADPVPTAQPREEDAQIVNAALAANPN